MRASSLAVPDQRPLKHPRYACVERPGTTGLAAPGQKDLDSSNYLPASYPTPAAAIHSHSIHWVAPAKDAYPACNPELVRRQRFQNHEVKVCQSPSCDYLENRLQRDSE